MNRLSIVKRLALPIFALAAIAGVFYSILFVRQWDTPPSEMQATNGTIAYGQDQVEVEITCNCPKVLTASILRSVPIQVILKLKPSRDVDEVLHQLQRLSVIEYIYLNLEAGGAVLEPEKIHLASTMDLFTGKPINQSFVLKIAPADTTLSQITFHFLSVRGSAEPSSLGSVAWLIPCRPRFTTLVTPFLYAILVLGLIAAVFFWTRRRLQVLRERTEERLADASMRAAANPERVRFAWDLARVKLEAYFDRNLIQVNLVFWVAVVVMAVGFGFVLGGVVLSFNQPRVTPTSMVAAVSGIITQFIGVTFMVIYRSTMAQANEFMVVLDRINSVGMAIQVLDSIPETEGQLKNATRAQIVELLIASPPEQARSGSRSASTHKKRAGGST
jgi:hypothetical protein